jgi:hypothetical protein
MRARIGNNAERAAALFDDIGILRRAAGKAGVPAVLLFLQENNSGE